jgi:hypothetical protein
MNVNNFGEPVPPFDKIDQTGQNAYIPVLNSDPFIGRSQVDAVITHEALMGITFVAVDPQGEKIARELSMSTSFNAEDPLGETVVHESPLGTSVAAVDPTLNEAIVHESVLDELETHKTPFSSNSGVLLTLLDTEESGLLRTRWIEIQGKFVDEPRSAVQQADTLVSEVVEKITRLFASEHATLESQWNQDMDVSTEDLRKALQHYRSFFNRLVGSV